MAWRRWRKPAEPLTPERAARVVELRDGGATWKDVGRALHLQDDVCRQIYAREKGAAARLATGGHMAARGHAE